MKITIFTGNQPRHLAFVRRLALVAEATYAVLESSTVFPGLIPDFYKRSNVMRRYFYHVRKAERALYGDVSFLGGGIRSLTINRGDLSKLSRETLKEALRSDIYIVFGASVIKGWLIDFLVSRGAINIHMGVSPYYRGSSCNFWALHDERPHLVGSTIHLLSTEIDGGAIIYHALPRLVSEDPFQFTMKAVESAQVSLLDLIVREALMTMRPVPQSLQVPTRYSKNVDFTDDVVSQFLALKLDNSRLHDLYDHSGADKFISPIFY